MENDFNKFVRNVNAIPTDICNIIIEKTLPPCEKKERYIKETGSHITHNVGDITVKCEYGDMDIKKILADLIRE